MGNDTNETKPFDKLKNDLLELEITQIGKKCHGSNCAIFREVGDCVMPKEGIFARVVKGGILKPGDDLLYVPKTFTAKVITLSDRASRGEYKDLSGPEVSNALKEYFSKMASSTYMGSVA